MNAPQYQRYPLVMNHPGERAAIVSQWDEHLKRHVPEHGEPARFQPVTVHNADDEEYHAAQGYRPVGGDAQTFTQQVNDTIVNPKPAGYAFSEYPKWVNGVLVEDPSKPKTAFQEYPKWVGDVLVGSAAEEAALRASQAPKPYIEEPAAPVPVDTPAATAMETVVIDGVPYSVSPAVAARLRMAADPQASSEAAPEAPTPKVRKTRAKKQDATDDAPKPERRPYRQRATAVASSADVGA